MHKYLAPAGAPLRISDLLRWAATAAAGNPETKLAHRIRTRFAIRHVYLSATGRAGLTLLLRALRRLAPAGRTEVLLPSYTCYSVAASVMKAGLTPRLVDISPDTLGFDLDHLANADFSRALAVVPTNLYGLPDDMPRIAHVCRDRGVFLIDDAAQSMGASVNDQPCGTWGDAGLYSFDKGKPVAAIDGGLVVTQSDEVATALHLEMLDLPRPSRGRSAMHIAQAAGYWLMLRPALYGIPAGIPQLGLGRTVFTGDFPLCAFDRPLAALALTMLPRLAAYVETRRRNAAHLIERLSTLAGVGLVTPVAGSRPSYLRLPMLLPDESARHRTLQVLTARGIGATASYPASLADVAEVRAVLADARPDANAGRDVARRILTLPTHPFVKPQDIERMADGVRSVLDGRFPVGTVAAEREAQSVCAE